MKTRICWEKHGYSYVNSWLLFTKEYEVDKTILKRMEYFIILFTRVLLILTPALKKGIGPFIIIIFLPFRKCGREIF